MVIDLNFIARLLPALLQGAVVTIELSVLTMLICLAWGLLVALAQATRGPLAWAAAAYIQIVRNTPLLIQMYIVYFGLPMIGWGVDGFESGLLAAAVGAVNATLVGGIGTLVVVALWMWWFPSLRRRQGLVSDPEPVEGASGTI